MTSLAESSRPFESSAAWYDAIYRDKDYSLEARVLLRLVNENRGYETPIEAERIFEGGVGTGRMFAALHAIGARYLGGCEPCREMREIAMRRMDQVGHSLHTIYAKGLLECHSEVRRLNPTLLLLNFNVLGYIAAAGPLPRLSHVLLNWIKFRRADNSEMVLAFDFIPLEIVAQKVEPVSSQEYRITDPHDPLGMGGVLNRTALKRFFPETATLQHDVTFTWRPDEGQSLRTREIHRVKCFSFEHLKDLLNLVGFHKIRFLKWPPADILADVVLPHGQHGPKPEWPDDLWNVLCVAS